MTKYEKEIEMVMLTTDDKEYRKISRFFLGISVHPEETNLSMAFLTKDSIMTNCRKYFGHKCDFFSMRLYSLLSNNVPLRRITFLEFMEKFYNVLIKKGNSNRLRSSFIF